MATLDDIPTLPPANTSLSGSDFLAIIDAQDRRSPKRTTLDHIAQIFGFTAAGGELSVPGIIVNTVSVINSITFPYCTVSALPAPDSVPYARAFVTDCAVSLSSSTIGTSGFSGGGANTVPVFCDGTAWIIG